VWMQIIHLLQKSSKKKWMVWWKKEKKDNHKRKEQIFLMGQISNFFFNERFLQKGRCATKRTPEGPWFNDKNNLY
jgi:hypothetical protein